MYVGSDTKHPETARLPVCESQLQAAVGLETAQAGQKQTACWKEIDLTRKASSSPQRI